MTVTRDDIINLIESAETMADIENLRNDVPLTQQEVDSLDMANILLLLEEKYEIKIPDEDLKKVQSVDTIVDYIKAL